MKLSIITPITVVALAALLSQSACDKHEHFNHTHSDHTHSPAQSTAEKTANAALAAPAIRSEATALDVQINNAWVRLAPATSDGVNTAAYLTIKNPSSQDLILESVSSTAAVHTMVHDTVHDERGMLRMQHLDRLTIAANSSVELEPQGKHIMLMGVKQELKAGTLFPITLNFKDMPAMTIKAFVKGIKAPEAADTSSTKHSSHSQNDEHNHEHSAHSNHHH